MRSLVEIGQVVLEKKRFKFLKCIFAISPWKRRSPSFEKKTLIPFTQGCFVLSLVEIGPMVLEKKILKSRPCFFFAISLLSRLGKGHEPSFEQN